MDVWIFGKMDFIENHKIWSIKCWLPFFPTSAATSAFQMKSEYLIQLDKKISSMYLVVFSNVCAGEKR